MSVWPVSLLLHLQRRVLPLEHVERVLQLLPLGARFRLDGHRDDRLRELDRLEQDRLAGVADRVAGDRLPHADDADDVAGLDAVDLLFLLGGVNVPELGDVFLDVLAGIEHAAVGLEHARIDADPVDIARLGGQHLEDQAAERLLWVGLADELLRLLLADAFAFDRRHVERAGQVVLHRVEHRLHADAVQGRAAQHRLKLHVDGRLAEHLADQLRRESAAPQGQLHQFVAVVVELFEHLLPPDFGVVLQLRRESRRASTRGSPCRPGNVSSFISIRSITPRNGLATCGGPWPTGI